MQDYVNLNFFSFIKDHMDNEFHDKYCQSINNNPLELFYFGTHSISYPVYRFGFSEQQFERRDALEKFLEYYVPIFIDISKNYHVNWEQFLPILFEIAKNSADHTTGDAYMGLDFIKSKKNLIICTLIGDVGPGIYTHIRDALLKENPNRKNKVDFSAAYRYALMKGFSGNKDSPQNQGLGMPFIVNNSIGIGVRLSIFDVKSRLLLSSLSPIAKREPPHNEIWRASQRIDGKKPFFYYLEYEVQTK